ncbi:MAG: hypothetical protein AB1522_13790 [Chloroflexota bacterium]
MQRGLNGKKEQLVGADGAWVGGKGAKVTMDKEDSSLLEIAEVDEKASRARFT